MAERAFLALARAWAAQAQNTQQGHPLPRSADELALACLLLAVEWGADFTEVAWRQMEINREKATMRRDVSWMDELSWKLCQCAAHTPPYGELDAVQELTANLDHHNSSIRCWMMELGWFAAGWLNPVEASDRLLKNLADTLMGPLMAAGLAARFFDDADSFLAYARDFEPAAEFVEQYRDRLRIVEERGIPSCQAFFWRIEAKYRQSIERCALGVRAPEEIKVVEGAAQCQGGGK
jgi:hypothetical protein